MSLPRIKEGEYILREGDSSSKKGNVCLSISILCLPDTGHCLRFSFTSVAAKALCWTVPRDELIAFNFVRLQ